MQIGFGIFWPDNAFSNRQPIAVLLHYVAKIHLTCAASVRRWRSHPVCLFRLRLFEVLPARRMRVHGHGPCGTFSSSLLTAVRHAAQFFCRTTGRNSSLPRRLCSSCWKTLTTRYRCSRNENKRRCSRGSRSAPKSPKWMPSTRMARSPTTGWVFRGRTRASRERLGLGLTIYSVIFDNPTRIFILTFIKFSSSLIFPPFRPSNRFGGHFTT